MVDLVEDRPVHSPLGASSAERWMNCPGSVALLKKLDLPETDEPDYRSLGTAAHAAGAKCMAEGLDAWEVVGQQFEQHEVDVEMADAVQVYLDTCRKLITPHGVTLIEQHLTARKHAQMYGTVDFAHVADSLLNIVDYKHGEGIVVEVEDNPQLKYYAYLVLQDYPDVRKVVLRVVQPRITWHSDGVVRRWECSAEDVCEWVDRELIPGMLATELDNDLDAGPWCRFCPAKLVCPLMTSLFGAACTSNPKKVVELTDAGIGRAYQYTQAVKSYLKALEEEAYRRLNLGKPIGGIKLVHKKANRVWKGGAIDIFKGLLGDDAYTPATLKSPAQMAEVSPAADKLVKEWAYTPESGLTVALESDKRVGVRVQTTLEVFKAAAEEASNGTA